MPTTIQLPPLPEKARVVDPRTGMIDPDWLRWFKALDTIIRSL